MNRRGWMILISALAGSRVASAQQGGVRVKLTALYGAPKNPEEFEKYYATTHMPLVAAVEGIRKIETSRGVPRPDGSPPTFYRMFEAWFDNEEHMTKVLGSPEWKKVGSDVPNFATGGITILMSRLD